MILACLSFPGIVIVKMNIAKSIHRGTGVATSTTKIMENVFAKMANGRHPYARPPDL